MAANSLKATLPSLQSTKVPREPILITKNECEFFFLRASREMISATRLYLPAFRSVTALIYQPPYPWEASDGPVIGEQLLILTL